MRLLGATLDIETSFKRSFLINKLAYHREVHVEELKKAMKVYEADRNLYAEKIASVAHSYKFDEIEQWYLRLKQLAKPVDATQGYDQYISILQAATDAEIKLSVSDANAIINDSWDWAVAAKTTNAFYSSR